MGRIPLQKDHVLNLKNSSDEMYQYIIKKTVNKGVEGSSCLCYIAKKIQSDERNKIVILKEFYPNNVSTNIIRTNNGMLIMNKEQDEKLMRMWNEFRRGVDCLNRFANVAETQEYICADPGTEVLEGNGTMYCENQFHNGALSWQEFSSDKEFKMDDIVQTALGTIRFLKQFHGSKMAYVDLKPVDVQIPVAENGEMDFGKPLFYDFNSALEINKKYKPWEISCTDEYKASGFVIGPDEDQDKELEVNLSTENCIYGKVVESQIKKKEQTVSIEIRDRMNLLFNALKKGSETMSENEVENELSEIRDQIRDRECEREYQKLPKRIKKFNVIRWINMFLTIAIYIVMTVIMSYMCINAEEVRRKIEESNNISITGIIVLLLVLTVGVTVLKLMNYMIGERIANTAVSVKYYYTPIRTGEYNTFRYGTRKRTTFQDDSENNMSRQRRRRGLWSVLAFAMVAGFGTSIVFESFPIFLVIGFTSLIIFTFADCVPANREFFENYARIRTLQVDRKAKVTAEEGRAIYYCQEYVHAGMSFDLSNEYYVKNNRDLFKIRDRVLNGCFHMKTNPYLSLGEKIRWTFDYKYRSELIGQCEMEDMDLGFAPLQIRHIYKMVFDRLRNKQLIVNLAVFLITLVAIFLDFMTYTGRLVKYFRVPEEAYLWITLIALISVCIISVCQVANSLNYEMLVAEVSYKSRFIIDEALNDELLKDIAANLIVPVDMSRGAYQYDGYITTEKNRRRRRKMENEESDFNRPLFHHREVANSNRLALTVWLTFGILFSIFVWHMGYYWMFFILLPVAILINVLFRKYVLPIWGKKQIVKDIEILLKDRGNM